MTGVFVVGIPLGGLVGVIWLGVFLSNRFDALWALLLGIALVFAYIYFVLRLLRFIGRGA